MIWISCHVCILSFFSKMAGKTATCYVQATGYRKANFFQCEPHNSSYSFNWIFLPRCVKSCYQMAITFVLSVAWSAEEYFYFLWMGYYSWRRRWTPSIFDRFSNSDTVKMLHTVSWTDILVPDPDSFNRKIRKWDCLTKRDSSFDATLIHALPKVRQQTHSPKHLVI